ncbi:MAG TPA: PTS sugar transporter subunit IIA [Anaerovoracaceae bacterium]|nr:PTS sugar transporter subunit IIA [Anaerovoracaceae bacterium]
MKEDQYFRKELIWLDMDYPDKEALFVDAGRKLHSLNYVRSDLGEALGRREADYPTGLLTEPFPVAIPHTDPEYVNSPCIAFLRLKKPILFEHMGEPEKTVPAQFIFVLGVKDPAAQVKVLSAVIRMISDHVFMQRLKGLNDQEEISVMLNNSI